MVQSILIEVRIEFELILEPQQTKI